MSISTVEDEIYQIYNDGVDPNFLEFSKNTIVKVLEVFLD